jgi:hypothetical protein
MCASLQVVPPAVVSSAGQLALFEPGVGHVGGELPSYAEPDPSTQLNVPSKHVHVMGTCVTPHVNVGPQMTPSTGHAAPTVSAIVAGHAWLCVGLGFVDPDEPELHPVDPARPNPQHANANTTPTQTDLDTTTAIRYHLGARTHIAFAAKRQTRKGGKRPGLT